MSIPELYVATAMISPEKTEEFWGSWREKAVTPFVASVVINGNPLVEQLPPPEARVHAGLNPSFLVSLTEVMGTVPAFAKAVAHIPDSAIIALLHDDLRIDQHGWDAEVMGFFAEHPQAVLAGFGGAYGVGAAAMYRCGGCGGACGCEACARPDRGQIAYTDMPCSNAHAGQRVQFDPMTLARHHFMSNMEHAEAHGERVVTARPVAVLDGFSLIGRGWFIKECLQNLMQMGVIHHAYDCYFGIHARRRGLQTWLLPIKCHHSGGRSAVGSAEYQEWAKKNHGGDQEVWRAAHLAVWKDGRDILPFDVREG